MKIDYGRHYRKWHADTPEHHAAMVAYYKRIFSPHLPHARSARILELGCGMGFAMMALQELGFTSVTGVDCDESQAAACREKGLDVTLTVDTPGFLISKASSFDLLIACDFLEHIPVQNQLEFVRAMGGALAQGGRLICTVPNANSALGARWRYIDWTHHCSFTEHSLEFLLANGGFENIQISEVEFVQRPRITWLPIRGTRHWWIFRFFRLWQRLQMIAELGRAQGQAVPLSLNLFCTAQKA